MKILVACEESQRVCKAFREKGHEAYSCDLKNCTGLHPEWHICDDVISIIDGDFYIHTQDGRFHYFGKSWDMIIAFPPCTYLTNAGMCNFTRKNSTPKYRLKRLENLYKSVEFVNKIYNANCEKIAIENPVGILSTYFMKPTQIIHPYEFGESVNKSTCLWLRGLPELRPTNIVKKDEITTWGNGKKISRWYRNTLKECGGDFGKLSEIRSKTFNGIAKAMAEQWG